MGDLESNDNLSSLSRSTMKKTSDEDEPDVISPTPPKNSILQLIPAYLLPHCKRPKVAELRMSYDGPTDQITYTYSITWEDSEESGLQMKSLLEKKASSTTRAKSKPWLAPFEPISVRTVCDGPCGKTFGSDVLYTVTKCNHHLCEKCQRIVANKDGTPACSSKSCHKPSEQKIASVSSKSSKSSVISTSSKSSSQEPVFKLVYPSTEEIVGVKLVLVEPSEQYRMTHCSSFVELEMVSSTKILKAVRQLLVRKKKREPDEYIRRGTLYFVQLKENWKRRIRRVPKENQELLALYDFPQVGEHIVFVLDMGDFVKNGSRIYFE